MTDTVESLDAKVKALQAAKAPAPEIKAAKDQLVALKKAAGQAKKAAAPKADDEDGESPTPAKAEAKAPAAAEAAKPAEPAKADAAKGKKATAAKPEAAKRAEPKLETPKGEERKKSEKAEESPKKEADRKKSEKVADPSTPATQDSVESLTAKVAELKLPKDAKAAAEKPAAGKKAAAKGKEAAAVAEPAAETPKPAEPAKAEAPKGGKKAATKPVAADDPPKAAEPVAETSAETGKKAKKVSERKQSTKVAEESPKPETKTEEPVKIHASGEKKLRILAISGSLRKESFNTSLLKFAQQSAPPNVEIVIADISGIPLYNQDTEYEPNPAVAKFKADVESADAILFSTPEFNFSLPGVLKNAIDVASRPWGKNSWANKPTGLWSASVGGFGGLRAQLSLRQSAVFLKLDIYPGDEFFVSDASKKFDANGLTDPHTKEKVSGFLEAFTKWVQARPQAQ